jgi:hypothetical protein
MPLRFISRGGWWGRTMRAGVAWFALLVLALPGFDSVRGLCCEPGLTKGSGCCVSAMKMAGMGESKMASMDGAPVMSGAPVDGRVAAIAECAMTPVGEGPEFVVRSEVSFERDLLPVRDQLPALAGTRCAELSGVAAPPWFFICNAPPKLFLFDPLLVSLQI